MKGVVCEAAVAGVDCADKLPIPEELKLVVTKHAVCGGCDISDIKAQQIGLSVRDAFY